MIIEITKKNKNLLFGIILLGLIFRILFVLVGAKFYYGTENFMAQGDTLSWINSFINLYSTGTYTCNIGIENAMFFRPPGYSFIMGIFYLLCGQNQELSFKVLAWFQVLLDTIAIGMIFSIVKNAGGAIKTALIASFLYAIYPFIIVWNPVLYAELCSVFFIITSLYFIYSNKKHNYLFAGIFIGLAVLTRLQCIFLFPWMMWLVWNKTGGKNFIKQGSLAFLLSFSVVYGSWPARNLIFHNRIMFAQDLRIGRHWSPDYLSFMYYIFAIKTDHQPQYQQIIENKKVEWPREAYLMPGDSAKLDTLIQLCRTCGTGFSFFKYYSGNSRDTLIPSNNCDSIIESGFNQLIAEQKNNNKLNYYLYTPLGNLKKALFKFSLYGNKSAIVKLAGSTLFVFRSFMIFLGLFAIFLNYKHKWISTSLCTMILLYFISWYFYICFSYRNMEIRYLLHCDLLLLIPAAGLISSFFKDSTKKIAS